MRCLLQFEQFSTFVFVEVRSYRFHSEFLTFSAVKAHPPVASKTTSLFKKSIRILQLFNTYALTSTGGTRYPKAAFVFIYRINTTGLPFSLRRLSPSFFETDARRQSACQSYVVVSIENMAGRFLRFVDHT